MRHELRRLIVQAWVEPRLSRRTLLRGGLGLTAGGALAMVPRPSAATAAGTEPLIRQREVPRQSLTIEYCALALHGCGIAVAR